MNSSPPTLPSQDDLLEWLTGYSPADPTMASHYQKVRESSSCSVPQGCMSQVVFSMCCNPEVGSKASEGTDVLARWGQVDKEQSFLLLCPYIDVQLKVWPRLKGLSLTTSRSELNARVFLPKVRIKDVCFLPQRSRLEVDSPTLNEAEKHSQMWSPFLDCSSLHI